ncbi:hypothetical protein BCR42DRAFT_425521 [Absidia repens]|uniref:Uncharacterized protein n=1 Tax=Absidia repens TaxID=90262 RepID=A0A1X2I289_9FUNG|nr:hypothetical protein BCR42DRAFT_425521 [Absidia repens]
MKTIKLKLNSQRRFDHDYNSEDIQEKWTQHDFRSILDVFHDAVNTCPPPKGPWVWFLFLLGCWTLECSSVFILFEYIYSTYFMMLSLLMFFTALILIWRYRMIRAKFETFLLELCDRLNATENIRGIHYNLVYQRPSWYCFWCKTTYTLCIDLDDRYQALTAQSYKHNSDEYYSVSIPDTAHVPHKLDSWDEKSSMYRVYQSPR